MLTILDCNNFWSPSGGGVRRYHLEKLSYFTRKTEQCPDIRYVFVMPDATSYSEQVSEKICIEHLRAPAQPGAGEYRLLMSARSLREVFQRHRPDIVEVGSPYILPTVVQRAILGLDKQPAVVGFWHADYPRTYVGRFFANIHPRLQSPAENVAWWWARRTYGRFNAVFVASRWMGENLRQKGFDRLFYTPLGVDSQRFDPAHRDESLRHELQAGDPKRLIIFFPHRLQEEKGVRNLIAAYRMLCKRMTAPALVFAGDGPDRSSVEALVKECEHAHYIGYLSEPGDMSRYYASCDLSVALSAFETFGLSTAEALASGAAMVAANQGGAAELVEDSGCGLTVPYGDSEALALAIERLAREYQLGELPRRGQQGREHVLRFTWTSAFDREVEAYREIAQCHQSGQSIPAGFHFSDPKSSPAQA